MYPYVGDFPVVCFSGDHIRIRRRPVWHHMLVVKVIDSQCVQVIHYTASEDSPFTIREAFGAISSEVSSRTFGSAEVIEKSIEIDLSKEKLELLRYPPGVAVYEGRQAIERIRKRIGERKYRLRTNNCEHLINWAITGKEESAQIDNVKVTVGTVLAGAAALGLALFTGAVLLYNARSSDRRITNRDDEEEEDSD